MDYSNSHTPHTTASASSTPMRSGTPDINPFNDDITPVPRTNPFSTPFASKPASLRAYSQGTSSAVDLNQQLKSHRYFHSRRVKKGEAERPWLQKKDPKEKWVTIIPLIGLFLGFGLAGFLVWDGMKTVINHTYCEILNEDWSGGFNDKVWRKEAEVGGFG